MAGRTAISLRAPVNFREDGGDLGTQCFRISRKWRQDLVAMSTTFNALFPDYSVVIHEGVLYEQNAVVVTFTATGDPEVFVDWVKLQRPDLTGAAPTMPPPTYGARLPSLVASCESEAANDLGHADRIREDESDGAAQADVLTGAEYESVVVQSGSSCECHPVTPHQVCGEVQALGPGECQQAEGLLDDGSSGAQSFLLRQPSFESGTDEDTLIFVESIEEAYMVEIGGDLFCVVWEGADEPDSVELGRLLSRSQLDTRAVCVADSHVKRAPMHGP